MNVEHLMTRDVLTVAPETSLKEVARLLDERGISGLPVCGPDGRVVGVVSEADIVRRAQGLPPHGGVLGWLLDRGGDENGATTARTAGEAMTSPALTIDAGRPVAEAARLMVERQVNRLPVVHAGRLVGIVTRADVVRAFRRSDEELEREIREDVLVHTLWIEPRRLEIRVDGGAVTLAGRLGTRTDAALAVAYVRRVPGVLDVRDELSWDVDDLARRSLGPTEKRVV